MDRCNPREPYCRGSQDFNPHRHLVGQVFAGVMLLGGAFMLGARMAAPRGSPQAYCFI